MLINGINFPEIKKEYDYFNVKVENRKLKLIYRIREYAIVPDRDKARNLKKNGTKLKSFGFKHSDGRVTTAYYQPYSIKQTSLKQKQRTIQKVLNLIVGENEGEKTLEQHIQEIWCEKNAHKTTKDALMDKEAMVLDVLATYYLGGVEGDGILTQDMSRTIQQKEIVTVAGMMGSDGEENIKEEEVQSQHLWEYRIMNKKKHARVTKGAPKRWKNSRTHKMINLFSFNDHKDELQLWDWIKEEWIGANLDYHYKIDRIIDPERPYNSKWCIVDTENAFKFGDEVLKIDESVEQYKVGKDNRAEMDWIFVIEQDGKRLYYDQLVNQIENKKIKMMGEV